MNNSNGGSFSSNQRPRAARYRWISSLKGLYRFLKENGAYNTCAQLLKDYGPRSLLCRTARSEPVRIFFGVEGQIALSECQLLYRLATQARGGAIVEIGSFRGLATICLARGAQSSSERPMVCAIEPHKLFVGVLGHRFVPEDKQYFLENIRRFEVESDITLIPLASLDALKDWSEPISLLWIDGDHRYAAVKADFLGWEPFLISGGIVVLHDTTDPDLGSARVVNELISNSKRFNTVRQVCTCTYAAKNRRIVENNNGRQS